jgi:hypothetical protein
MIRKQEWLFVGMYWSQGQNSRLMVSAKHSMNGKEKVLF